MSPVRGTPVVNNGALKTLPPPPAGAVFNADEQAKYRAFKEARLGAADFMAMEGDFARYLEDVYSSNRIVRNPLTDTCEILVVGAGFAGLLLWYKLSKAGFTDVRFLKRVATWAAPGIGTAIRASPATWNLTATCRSWRR